MTKCSNTCLRRSGVTAVEFAVVAPVLFLVVFAFIEIGRGMMAAQSLEEAARSACRVAILREATNQEIAAEVTRILAPSGIHKHHLEVFPTKVDLAEKWSPVSVTVTASFADMSWLPLPRILGEKKYASTCTLPKEYSPGS